MKDDDLYFNLTYISSILFQRVFNTQNHEDLEYVDARTGRAGQSRASGRSVESKQTLQSIVGTA